MRQLLRTLLGLPHPLPRYVSLHRRLGPLKVEERGGMARFQFGVPWNPRHSVWVPTRPINRPHRRDHQGDAMTDQSGGNRFIPGNATPNDLMVAIACGVRDLRDYARRTGRGFDPGALSVTTERREDGRIAVGVYGALVELDWSTKGRRERAEPITDSEGAW